jgi:ribose/xylose/arabinose/galactoside ABC-type transport system permease subunit
MGLLFQQTAIVAALAIGQTLVILTAGIDLSVGAIMVLSMMVMAALAKDGGMPGRWPCSIGLALATGAGLLNGLLVTRINLPPFIVTLGTCRSSPRSPCSTRAARASRRVTCRTSSTSSAMASRSAVAA